MTGLQRRALRVLVKRAGRTGLDEHRWKLASGANVRTIDALERDGLVTWTARNVARPGRPQNVERFYRPTAAGRREARADR